MRVIVLAGGGGTRLWPLSREDFPKQFLSFGDNLSLLQKTVHRLLRSNIVREIIVATNSHHCHLVQKQLGEIDPQQKVKILIEPFRKNTAPAIGLSIKYLQTYCHADPAELVLILPSDHLIEPEAVFLQALEEMREQARQKWIVTFGIRPTKPETGYGYIQIGEKQNDSSFKANRFVEKPNLQTAEKYLADPHFYWNAGIFLFSIETFWSELSGHSPVLSSLMEGSYDVVFSRFEHMPDLSIDYAIMEKSKSILVCPLEILWSDVGSWDSVYEIMEKDQNKNAKVGRVLDIDTKNCLIVGGKRLVSTIGLEDLLIVETEDAVFIGKRGESQKVRDLVKKLAEVKRKEIPPSAPKIVNGEPVS